MNAEPPPTLPPGWTLLPPAHVPEPTFSPAGLALGTMFIFWGLITSIVVLGVGICLFAVSLAGWIQQIRHERN